MISFLKKENGAVLMLFAILLPVLLGCTAIVVDFGSQYACKVRLDNIAQAAALAAAQDLQADAGLAEDKAYEYLNLNGIEDQHAQVQVSGYDNSVEVTIQRDVDFFFGRILGLEDRRISSKAKAISTGLTSLSGAAPLGILSQDFVYGQLYKLKCGAPPEFGSGNFGALRLGGSGSSVYEENLKYGYQGKIEVGDIIETKSGNISGPTQRAISYRFSQDSRVPPNTIDDYDRNAPQIIYIPVVEPYQTNDNHVYSVRVLGFAAFFVAGIPGSGDDSEIEGYFIRTVHSGTGSEGQPDYGLTTSKLVNP
ncbi:MAG: pilus assembly protein TadG-related protein [Bacillota bacterium]|nr:pilus assembly protein TadG-related protein [Bacillota bacterium]